MISTTRLERNSLLSDHSIYSSPNSSSLSRYSKNRNKLNTKDEPKTEFRKLFLSRNKHSRIQQVPNKINIDKKKDSTNNFSFIDIERQINPQNELNATQNSHSIIKFSNDQKKNAYNIKQKDNLKLTKFFKNNKNQQMIERQKKLLQKIDKLNFQNQQIKSTARKINITKIDNSINTNNQLIYRSQSNQSRLSSKNLRPYTSSKNQISTSHLSNIDKQLNFLNDKKQYPQQIKKQLSIEQIKQIFNNSQTKINNLIRQKWSIMGQQIKNQKDLKKNISNLSMSKLMNQRNINLQIMQIVKYLRSINIQKLKLINNQSNFDDIQLQRCNIIDQALAQSMVQADLIRKYFANVNSNGLSTSNHKVGQTRPTINATNHNDPNLNALKNLQKLVSRNDQKISVSNSTENNAKYKIPKQTDYEQYRHKPANFKLNLQPLPRSAYQQQFLDGGFYEKFAKFKQNQNLIFPKTCPLKDSSYRDQYKAVSTQKHQIKQLDAYKDKYKLIDISYMPKKRTVSQSHISHRKQTKLMPKYVNKIQYIKRLKTQSTLKEQTFIPHVKQPKYSFLSENQKEYSTQRGNYIKSEIKHKKLYDQKYQMKMKLHV